MIIKEGILFCWGEIKQRWKRKFGVWKFGSLEKENNFFCEEEG